MIIAFALECSGLWLYFHVPAASGALGTLLFLLCHIPAAVLIVRAVLSGASSKSRRATRPRLLNALLLFAIPALLPGVGFIFVLSFEPSMHSGGSSMSSRFQIGPKLSGEVPVTRQKTEEKQSMLAILGSSNSDRRRKAILAMRHFNAKGFIPVLKRSLQDSDEQVRLFSQHILQKILETDEHRIARRSRQVCDEEIRLEDWIVLAESYHESIYLGLISDREVFKQYLGKAIECLEKAAGICPANHYVRFLLVKYSIEAGDVAKARTYLAQLQRMNSSDPFIVPWELEILFLERDWKAFAKLFHEKREYCESNPKLRHAARFWFASPASSLAERSNGVSTSPSTWARN